METEYHSWLRKGLLLAWLIPALGGMAQGAGLPRWDLSKMAGLDEAQWGPVAKEGNQTYRVVKAGKSGMWKAPAWWGDSYRPRTGTVYVLEIRYKDVLTRPAVFSAHAGLATHWRLSEIHRFGGLADGKWKTAQVPVSWDLVCRIKGENNTSFAIRTGREELPIGSVTVRLARRGDAERFARETREWVARLDAARFPKVAAAASEKPVLPEPLAAKALVPFVRPYMGVIRQSSAPAAGEAGATIKLRMTRDEFESASFGVYANGGDLNQVICRLSDLTGPGGTLGGAELKTLEYALVSGAASGSGSNERRARPVPLRLWPAFAVDIPAGRSHGFWLTVRTEYSKTRPGTYRGKVAIRSGAESAEIPVEVEVLPLRLLTIDEAGVAFGACISALPSEQEMQTFSDYNLRTAQTRFHSTNLPLVYKDGQLNVDFAYLDEWMEMAKSKHLAFFRYLLGGNPYGYPDTMTGEKAFFAQLHPGPDSERQFIEAHKAYKDKPESAGVLPEIRPLYAQFAQKFAAHAKEKGWPQLVLEPFDEPAKWAHKFLFPNSPAGCLGSGEWIKYHFHDAAKLLHESARDALVGVTVHHAKNGMIFVPDADLASTNAIHQDLKMGEKIHAAGKIFWQYSGCNATQPPSIPRYSYGFYYGTFGSTGGVTWAMNFVNGFDLGDSEWWAYSWYTPFGTVTSPAYEGMREGLDDRRLIETCRKEFKGRTESEALLQSVLKDARESRASGGTDTVNDFYIAIREVGKLDLWRNRLLDELLKLQKTR